MELEVRFKLTKVSRRITSAVPLVTWLLQHIMITWLFFQAQSHRRCRGFRVHSMYLILISQSAIIEDGLYFYTAQSFQRIMHTYTGIEPVHTLFCNFRFHQRYWNCITSSTVREMYDSLLRQVMFIILRLMLF